MKRSACGEGSTSAASRIASSLLPASEIGSFGSMMSCSRPSRMLPNFARPAASIHCCVKSASVCVFEFKLMANHDREIPFFDELKSLRRQEPQTNSLLKVIQQIQRMHIHTCKTREPNQRVCRLANRETGGLS